MSADTTQSRTAAPLTRPQKALCFAVLGAGALLWVVSLPSPIPSGGQENRDKARAFLKERFPDREVSPHDSATAPVAVVYELIRSGEPPVARQAIDFAAEQRFGHAAPYVIDRLGSDDPKLERAAQDFLRAVTGRDHGPDADAWRAWWRDPPRKLLGVVSVGHTTLTIAIPAALALAGVCLMVAGWRGRRWVAELGPPLVGLALLMGCFLIATRLGGNSQTCTFGPGEVTYYVVNRDVVGLEDARVGGMGHWIVLCAVGMFGGLALVLASAVLAGRRARAASMHDS
jgi:hypothetical protein